MSRITESDARALVDYAAPHALGAAGAPRVNVGILARALVLADDACRSDIETFCAGIERGVWALTDLTGQRARTLADADPDTVDKVMYLVDRGLAELHADADGGPIVVLALDRFGDRA